MRAWAYQNRMAPEKKLLAKEMRNNPTPAEAVLWNRLRGRQLGGYRFLRQRPMLGYIADFYCPAVRLVIEVDGSSHDDRAEYDATRDRNLRAHSFEVIRFTNREVAKDLHAVLARIQTAIALRSQP